MSDETTGGTNTVGEVTYSWSAKGHEWIVEAQRGASRKILSHHATAKEAKEEFDAIVLNAYAEGRKSRGITKGLHARRSTPVEFGE